MDPSAAPAEDDESSRGVKSAKSGKGKSAKGGKGKEKEKAKEKPKDKGKGDKKKGKKGDGVCSHVFVADPRRRGGCRAGVVEVHAAAGAGVGVIWAGVA